MGNGILFTPTRNQGRLLGQENLGQRGQKEQGEEKAQGVLQAEQDGLAHGLVFLLGKEGIHGGRFLGDVPGVVGRAVSSFLIILIRLYKHSISLVFPSSCRFHPSCSEYAIVALERHGLLKGLSLSAWRLARCGPWSAGGYDPVPEHGKEPGNAPASGFNEQQGTSN